MRREASAALVAGAEGAVDWRLRAACQGTPSLVFWPDHLDDQALANRVRRVNLEYCSTCPVRQQCSEMPDKGYGGIYAGRCYGRPAVKRGRPPKNPLAPEANT